MKTTFASILLSIATLLFLGCAASRVKTEWDVKANLNQYKSFRFIDSAHQKTKQAVLLIDNAIHQQVTHELTKRGIKEGTTKPNMLVLYHTYTEKVRDTLNNQLPMMYGGESWRFYPWSAASAAPYPYEYWSDYNPRTMVYTEGTLIIDIVDTKTKQLVWRGSISDAIPPDQAGINEDAVKAVELIFRKYPIKPIESSKTPAPNKKQ